MYTDLSSVGQGVNVSSSESYLDDMLALTYVTQLYRPLKTGGLFAPKALRASILSCVTKTRS